MAARHLSRPEHMEEERVEQAIQNVGVEAGILVRCSTEHLEAGELAGHGQPERLQLDDIGERWSGEEAPVGLQPAEQLTEAAYRQTLERIKAAFRQQLLAVDPGLTLPF